MKLSSNYEAMHMNQVDTDSDMDICITRVSDGWQA